MTKTPDQHAHTAATSPAGPIPVQAPIPTRHAENTGVQDTLDLHTGNQAVGNAPQAQRQAIRSAEAHAHPREEPLKVTVKRRLEAEGRWAGQIEQERDEMMKLARERFSTKDERQDWVYGELDRLYPPLTDTVTDVDYPTLSGDPEVPKVPTSADTGQIQGLGDIPNHWPDLPANASLSAEVAWVQANRLRVVTERPGAATRIRLDLALSPAPSWAALGWLETSIRSYAKFVDVAAKATASDDGESSVMKRERMAIAEVHALLEEMMVETRAECRRRLTEEG